DVHVEEAAGLTYQLAPLANDLSGLFDASLPHYGGAIDGDAVSGSPSMLADLANLSHPRESALVHLAGHYQSPSQSARWYPSAFRYQSSACCSRILEISYSS